MSESRNCTHSGIVSRKITKSNKCIITLGVSVYLAISLIVLFLFFGYVKSMAFRLICGGNMTSFGVGLNIYAKDNDSNYPPLDKWCDTLISECKVPKKYFRCPGAKNGNYHYAINENVVECGASGPSDLVLVFETSSAEWNQTGGPELLSTDNHSGKGCIVLYLDGYVEFVRTEDIDKLRWTAEEKPN